MDNTLQITKADSEEKYIEFEPDKNQTWENNHILITRAIALLIRQNERMPSKAEIAVQAGLSRQTVHKHLKQFGNSTIAEEQLEQFNFMASKVLAKIIELAMDGDVRAARLSLEIMGILKNQNKNNKT